VLLSLLSLLLLLFLLLLRFQEYDDNDVDPLCGNQKRVGGSPHYRGKAGQVMVNIISWALMILPQIAQTCPGSFRH
jgi:hypothetical protein